MRKRVTCPFCEGDGCCFCDHEGMIYVGPNEIIKSEEGLNSIGVQRLKAADPGEIWPEMWEFHLDEKNANWHETLNQRLVERLKKLTEAK